MKMMEFENEYALKHEQTHHHTWACMEFKHEYAIHRTQSCTKVHMGHIHGIGHGDACN
jgi:hypothetical protein